MSRLVFGRPANNDPQHRQGVTHSVSEFARRTLLVEQAAQSLVVRLEFCKPWLMGFFGHEASQLICFSNGSGARPRPILGRNSRVQIAGVEKCELLQTYRIVNGDFTCMLGNQAAWFSILGVSG